MAASQARRERLDLIDFPLGDVSVMRKRRRWSV